MCSSMSYKKWTIKKMENLHVNIDYSYLITCRLNKVARLTHIEDNNNDSCFSDDAFIEMQNLKCKSIRPRKKVEG